MSEKIKLAVNGACGRMGRMVLSAGFASADFDVVAAIDRSDHPLKGEDAGVVAGAGPRSVALTDALKVKADVLVDFSVPEASLARLAECAKAGVAIVVATTGFTDDEAAGIKAAAKKIPVLQAANMSLGINYLLKAVAQTASALGDAFDIEIIEIHHKHKKDAPSGTALALGRAVAEALNKDLSDIACHGRHGIVGERKAGEIGFHAVRGGDVVGDHTIVFAGPGERIELIHKATSRETFARGALRAARFLAGKKAGFYTMADVLGL